MNLQSATMRRAKMSFRIAALAIWLYAVVVLCQTIWFRDQYADIFYVVMAVVAFITALGFCAYRGGRLCIVLASLIAGYNWLHRFEYFSWSEWVSVVLFAVAVISGFIGAMIYHKQRPHEAA